MAIDLTHFDPEAMSSLHVASVGGARHMLLSNHEFRLRSAFVETPLGGIIHGRYSAEMRVQQGVPEGVYFIGFIFAVRGRFVADGVPLTAGDMVVFPPGSEVGAVLKADFEWGILAVPTQVLHSRSAHFIGKDVAEVAPRMRVISGSEAGPLALRRQADALARLRRLTGVADTTRDPTEDRLDWIEDALQTFLEAPLEKTPDRQPVRSHATFRRVEEYLEAHAHRPIYVHELCAAAGMSIRHIRGAFAEVVGVPPSRYLELIRLHHARALLRTAPSVKYAALLAGNVHLSRFSEHYARLFGEKPSETLHRGHHTP